MRLVLLLIALAAAAVAEPVLAQQPPTVPPSTQENNTSKMTVEQCLNVLGGLRGLNGYQQIIKENGQERAIAQPYKIGDIRWTVSLNIAALEPIEKLVARNRNDLVTEIGHGKPFDEKSPEWGVFVGRVQKEVLDKPCDIVLARIRLDQLKLGDGADKNAIPPSTIAALMSIIDQ